MNDSRIRCSACGSAEANHKALWLASTGDVLALWLPATSLGSGGFLYRLSERFLSLLGRIGFSIGKALGIVALSNDVEKTVSNRSRLLWLEATRRGIQMEQLLFFGNPTDSFRVRLPNSNYFFKSLPMPPPEDGLRMDDKILFKRMMAEAELPVPKNRSAYSLRDAQKALAEFSIVCVKPRSGSNARHTYPYVRTKEDLAEALASVKVICAFASVEEHLEGNLCRATCVDGKLIGFLESQYPAVVGDGESTVLELIDKKNAARPEGIGEIVIDDSHKGFIRRRGHELTDVLPSGTSLQLTYRAGSSLGGSNREHGLSIHPSFIEPIERAARLTKLPIVGFDIIIPNPMESADSQRWGFVEANSLPWIDLHATPFYGEPIDLAPAVWDLWERVTRYPARDTR